MKLFAFVLISSLFFLAGILVTHYQLFPYPQIKKAKQYFFPSETAMMRGNDEYYSRKVSQHQMQKGQQFDVLFVGDSLFDEADWGYLFPNKRVANFGINADTTHGVLKRLETITHVESDSIFLMIGINDIFRRNNMSSIQKNYQHIVENLVRDDRKLYLLSCLYVGAKQSDFIGQIEELNHFIENIARAHQTIHYIDLNPLLATDKILNPEYTNDGIHLNGRAYRRLADKIAQYMNE